MNKQLGDKRRNIQVEGLRGAAILCVVLYHVFCRFKQIYTGMDDMYTEPLGRLGVLIFLIISCWYLVDFNEINRDKFDLKKYYKGKLVRLWPCYAISITLTAIIVHFFYLPDRMSTWGDWLLNLFFINGFVGTPYVDGAHWYLTTLVAFIMIVGCAKKFRIDRSPAFYLMWIFILIIAIRMRLEIIYQIIGGNYVFVLSIIISVHAFIAGYARTIKNKFLWLSLGMVSGVGIVLFLGIKCFFQIVFILPLFLGCLHEKIKIMECKFLVFLGMTSYSIYLIHQNVAYEVEYYLMKSIGHYTEVISIVGGVVAVLSGAVLYYGIDKFNKNFNN